MFADVGFLLDDGELPCVGLQCYLWKLVVVLLQYADNGRKEHDIKLRSGLDAGSAWKDQIPVVAFGFGKVGGHKVGVRQAGVALNQEQIKSDLS